MIIEAPVDVKVVYNLIGYKFGTEEAVT